MKIEDRTKKKVSFDTLKTSDVFEFVGYLYMKVDLIYAIDPANSSPYDIETYIKNSFTMNAYNLTTHRYAFLCDEEVQTFKATLVIE